MQYVPFIPRKSTMASNALLGGGVMQHYPWLRAPTTARLQWQVMHRLVEKKCNTSLAWEK